MLLSLIRYVSFIYEQRAFQRTLGTIIGTLVAVVILYFEPSTWPIVILIAILMSAAELLIVVNYTIAVTHTKRIINVSSDY
ncbi:FUSC family protein [Mammaliicoccus lentus]|uniref:FUSC family protein n=1 Tax=Mammaliicoccus lentus TaxID=42858 RepID=A0AAX3W678_MAMLE|nr:FUSC family protein [Mammaliicoccus lentus]WHI60269.1 FUSC family protein [Mammaliicoccus lentus]